MSDSNNFHLLLIVVEVAIDDSSSLKAKRAVLNKIKDRVRSRFNASISEVGSLDKWQRGSLAITMVSNEKKKLQKDADMLEAGLSSMTECHITQFSREWL